VGVIFCRTLYNWTGKVKEDQFGKACSALGENNQKERDYFEDLGAGERIILKWI
jgi:hypothetical protein